MSARTSTIGSGDNPQKNTRRGRPTAKQGHSSARRKRGRGELPRGKFPHPASMGHDAWTFLNLEQLGLVHWYAQMERCEMPVSARRLRDARHCANDTATFFLRPLRDGGPGWCEWVAHWYLSGNAPRTAQLYPNQWLEVGVRQHWGINGGTVESFETYCLGLA